ncbi:hypothetical protein, partial [Escherichia coli]|uniref:hypothetical protein n=1 Tax=Escherichia coli TaxID=562 RepID=UPI003BA2523E
PGVAVDAQIQTFLAGDDVILDREFFLHDIAASAAHAQGLQHIGILSADELDGLLRETFDAAVREHDLRIVGSPRIDKGDEGEFS